MLSSVRVGLHSEKLLVFSTGREQNINMDLSKVYGSLFTAKFIDFLYSIF